MSTLPLIETSSNKTEMPANNEVLIYGSFLLGNSEFALPTSAIKEVVNEPTKYTSVPRSPDYLLGLFNLRGSIIPVVNLASIFHLNDAFTTLESSDQLSETRKVAIIEHGNLSLGILFDATGEVFNNFDVETYLFETDDSSAKDQVIAGVFKLDGGSRIIQLIDVVGTLRLDRIPQTPNARELASQIVRRGNRNQCISFTVGNSSCALDIAAIREIVNIGKIENTVLAGSLCLGAIDLRGKTVPIVNFSLLLGYDDSAKLELHESDSHRVIIMKVEEHLFGLLVGCIGNIISYYDDALMSFPALGDPNTELFSGCLSDSNREFHTIVLNHEKIFTSEEIRTITKGHSSLFKDADQKIASEKQISKNLKTLITFSLDLTYGLDIGEISEVIDYPGELISTPSMAAHIRGMVNLRTDLVAIIDTRKLYALEDFADYKNCKILVFEHEDEKYGLLVDSVDSIVPFRQNQSIPIPRSVFNTKESEMDQDIKEAVMIEKANEKHTICILDLQCIAKRVGLDNAMSGYSQCA